VLLDLAAALEVEAHELVEATDERLKSKLEAGAGGNSTGP